MIRASNLLPNRQLDFRTGKPTADAVQYDVRWIRDGRDGYRAFVLLDVRYAIHTAKWVITKEGVSLMTGIVD